MFNFLDGVGDFLEEVEDLFDSLGELKDIIEDGIDDIKQSFDEFEDVEDEVSFNLNKSKENLKYTYENYLDSKNIYNVVNRELFSEEITDLKLGDHLFVTRLGYTHHGIYIGDNQIIHYLQIGVKIDSLEEFAKGFKILRKTKAESPVRYVEKILVKRAKSRLGEDKYFLLDNNCEHFVRWCRNGEYVAF